MIFVAIGGNLGAADGRTSYQLCNEAVDALACLPGLELTARSRWYRSRPVPRSDQPDYVNGVVRLDATLGLPEPEPAALLSMLQAIELSHGRRRSAPNAARTLDLDIIAMGADGALRRDGPDPIVPHPRLRYRAFVLLPLRDIAPSWVHPELGLDVDRLLHELPTASRGEGEITVLAG